MADDVKMELYNDNFQNFKQYNIPKAQLVIADIPYNVGTNFYGSNPEWYNDGDNSNGESDKAGKAAFNTDFNFNIVEYFAFCNKLLKPEPKAGNQQRGRSSEAPCMIMFCAFEQLNFVIETAAKYGFKNYIPLVFIKDTSPQVLKANMRVVGATEYALILYRGRLPKFRNNGQMIKNWFKWEYDDRASIPKVHPTQKPLKVLERLIELFTDEGDVIYCDIPYSNEANPTYHGIHESGFDHEAFYKWAAEQPAPVYYSDYTRGGVIWQRRVRSVLNSSSGAVYRNEALLVIGEHNENKTNVIKDSQISIFDF